MSLPILIADDDSDVLRALRLLLKNAGYAIDSVSTPAEVIEHWQQRDYALLLMDMNYRQDTTSGQEGLELISRLREQDASLPVVVMTGWGTVELAVEAMRRGANDFIEKPWDNTRLLTIIRQQLERRTQQQQQVRLSAENALLKSAQHNDWIADSAVMRQLMTKTASIANTDINVLLTGANGTGKSQLAQRLHEQSSRASQPFISVNMGAIPEQLFESELFGHVKGAFTDARETRIGRFELADNGTLFLDEVGNLPLSQQAKLLRVLESGEFEKVGSNRRQRVNVRVISATNADLPTLIEKGQFRQDLYYRLCGLELRLPSLAERPEDILPLARYFLHQYSGKYQRPINGFSDTAASALQAYAWPGNVRELKHCIERAVVLSEATQIEAEALALHASTANSVQGDWQTLTMEQAEKRLLEMALARHDGNANAAAEALGLSRSAFYRRLEKYR